MSGLALKHPPPRRALPVAVHRTLSRKDDPIEVVMVRAAGRTSIGSGAYRDRTGDLRLAKAALSQLS